MLIPMPAIPARRNEESIMSQSIENAIRNIIIFPASAENDQPGVAYGDVEFNGRRYNIQYSRGRLSDGGIHVYCDDGHEPNGDFQNAVNAAIGYEIGMEWNDVVEHIVFASRAEAAIEASEAA
jgi:hypothetical protein